MKQRIPADVERLMWLVAENNDPQAVADFESRFPDLRYELAQRRRMVSDLKHAKGGANTAEIPIPTFRPSPARPIANSRQIFAAVGLGLAALAAASYSVTKWATTPVSKPEPPPVVRTDPAQPEGGGVVYKQLPTPPQNTTTGAVNPNPIPETAPPTETKGEQPKTVKMSNTSLIAALRMIGSESGYNVDVAPGFEDQTVTLDYQDQTPSQILKDLGLRYNFTAFDQGDGTIIIVPAVDDGKTPGNDLNGSQRKIGG